MKKYIHKGLIGLFALCLSLSVNASDKDKQEFTKKVEKSFSVNDNAILELDTQFASVDIESWDKNEIKIVAEIIAEAKNQDAADKLFKKVDLDFSGGGNSVKIESSLRSNVNNDCSEGFEINIKIFAPKDIGLEAVMSFGDFDFDNIEGESDIHISFGDLDGGKLTHPENELFVEFGDADIDELGAEEIDVSFGDLEVDLLMTNCEVNNSYGDIQIDMLNSSITNLEINDSFGSVSVGIRSNTNATIEAYSSFGSVNFNSDFEVKLVEEGMFDTEKTATLNGGGSLIIEVSTSYGSVNFKVK